MADNVAATPMVKVFGCDKLQSDDNFQQRVLFTFGAEPDLQFKSVIETGLHWSGHHDCDS